MHSINNCKECQELMIKEGRGCKIFQYEAVMDYNYIEHVLEMEKEVNELYEE